MTTYPNMRNRLLLILTAAVSMILMAGCSVALVPANEEIEPGRKVEIEIKEGMTLSQVAQLLEEEGIVENGFVFRLYVQQQQMETALLPGEYTLVTGSEMEEVLKTITAGPQIITYKLIIPEGFTVDQIKERILQLPFIGEGQVEPVLMVENYDYSFLDGAESLEGFLFPKTYEVPTGYGAKDIVNMLISQYQLETSQLDYSFAQEKELTPYQILIVASLIEREAYIAEERELISAVIHNRLDIGMPLGIDATIRYGLDKWDQELTVS
ncbi:MAG: endolytic transglycosylase MltG [Actinomycetota bacterium]|nr:endolytic transglycosylase MltG [Actinomycetota bacterium]